MNVGKIITDYIDTVHPKHADDNAEVYSDAIRSIRFLASRDWKEYEGLDDERPDWTKQNVRAVWELLSGLATLDFMAKTGAPAQLVSTHAITMMAMWQNAPENIKQYALSGEWRKHYD